MVAKPMLTRSWWMLALRGVLALVLSSAATDHRPASALNRFVERYVPTRWPGYDYNKGPS